MLLYWSNGYEESYVLINHKRNEQYPNVKCWWTWNTQMHDTNIPRQECGTQRMSISCPAYPKRISCYVSSRSTKENFTKANIRVDANPRLTPEKTHILFIQKRSWDWVLHVTPVGNTSSHILCITITQLLYNAVRELFSMFEYVWIES